MITDKDVADKRNEVKMLRLERDEMLIRRQLDRAKQKSELTDASTLREANALREANETIHNAKTYIACLEAELSNCKSAIGMKNGVINDHVEHLDRVYNQLHGFQDDMHEKNKTIDVLTETTRKLKGRLSSMYAANSDQATTINKLNALLADEKMTLAAYRSNPLSDQVADRDDRIEQLMVLNEALRVDTELAHNLSRDHIAGQDRFIEGLKTDIEGLRSRMTGARIIIDNQATSIEELRKDLDARNQVIKDFKAIEQKETDRLHKIIEEFKSAHRVYRKCLGDCRVERNQLNHWFCEEHNKLGRIESFVDGGVIFTKEYIIDKITKIIQEE